MTPKEKSAIESDIAHNDTSLWGIWTTGIESVDGGLFAAAKHTGDRLTLILRGFDVDNFEAIAEFEATLLLWKIVY